MKLDMTKIKSSLQQENDELLKKGLALPYLEDGKVKFLTSEPLKTTQRLRETA